MWVYYKWRENICRLVIEKIWGETGQAVLSCGVLQILRLALGGWIDIELRVDHVEVVWGGTAGRVVVVIVGLVVLGVIIVVVVVGGVIVVGVSSK